MAAWLGNAMTVSEVLRQAKSVPCRIGVRSTFDRAVRRKPLALAAGAGNYGFSMTAMNENGDTD